VKVILQDLIASSGVAFGTSGARGLATAMTDRVCYAYTQGFLQYLESCGDLQRPGAAVAVAGDLRPSTSRVMEAVCRAAEDRSHRAINCGRVPSPAVALLGLEQQIPSIMVTGSHIPDDRNGIKFNKATGEMLKNDEPGVVRQIVAINANLFDAEGWFAQATATPRAIAVEAEQNYLRRYLDFFCHDALRGLRVGVYQHSAVGRDLLVHLLAGLGAEVVALGRSDQFIPVDTEAIRPEDLEQARRWTADRRFDALVSTDGDSDRPLVSDERGNWLRGDVVGVLCARFLEADTICTPVSCSTAVEKCGWFRQVRRTRIGSPHVIAAMQQATAGGARVVGYEANGGFLLGFDLGRAGRQLRALPTRDAVIAILGVLLLARQEGQTVAELAATLPARFTASDRLTQFPTERSAAILARFNSGIDAADRRATERLFGDLCGPVAALDRTDGLRITFANAEIIHLRPSGNAPEFRCYTEASEAARARALNASVLRRVERLGR
jgi:phosphomannomutase